MADVASAANVSNGTLFNYFATKQELIDELYIWVKSDLAEAISAIDEELSIHEQMRLIWDLWLEWASSQREAHAVMNLLHQSGLASEAARVKGSELIGGPMQVLGTAYATGLLVDLPLNYLVSLIEHHFDQAVASELNKRERYCLSGAGERHNQLTSQQLSKDHEMTLSDIRSQTPQYLWLSDF